MKCLALVLLVASVRGFDEATYDIWDPFAIEFEHNDFDDSVRLKRDPYKVYITIENQKKNVNSQSFDEVKMERDFNGPSQVAIVKACKCKTRKPVSNPETPQEVPETPQEEVPETPQEEVPEIPQEQVPETPQEEVPETAQENVPEYPPTQQESWKPMEEHHDDLGHDIKNPEIYQPIHGRINADKHSEFSQPEKDIWAMNSEELESGVYANPYSISDYHSSVRIMDPSQFVEPTYYKKSAGLDYYQAPQHEGLPTNPFADLTQQDFKEMEIIERIKLNHDFNHSGSDYDQKRRIQEAVLDYIKSKYYTMDHEKRVIAHTPHM